MKRSLLLILTLLFGISIQALAGKIVKAPYPSSAIATQVASTKTTAASNSAPAPQVAVATATSTPALPTVTVWPNPTKGGQPILFKAPSDPGTPIQLTLLGPSGKVIFSTAFSRKSRSGGYVWRLHDSSDSPVAGGVYGYVLRFKQQGQEVTAQGKVTVFR